LNGLAARNARMASEDIDISTDADADDATLLLPSSPNLSNSAVPDQDGRGIMALPRDSGA